MSDLIRDAPIGQIIRYITKGRMLQYPEEKSGFTLPSSYQKPSARVAAANRADKNVAISSEKDETNVGRGSSGNSVGDEAVEPVEEAEKSEPANILETVSDRLDLERAETAMSRITTNTSVRMRRTKTQREGAERVVSRTALSNSATQADLQREYTIATLAKGPSEPIHPTTLGDGTTLVDFYDTDDPENPQNYSSKKKMFIAAQICLYTFAVYMGSSIYAPSTGGVQQEFGVGQQLAYMGLSMYVLAYGIGPLLWSSLSEIPAIGRNPPYMVTFAIFVVLCIPTALADNFAGLIVLRFLQGFFGSPCLATGGATMGDLYSIVKLPYILSIWALAATGGPSLGPVISGFSVAAKNWRWALWEILWVSGPMWLVMFFFLPETYAPNILMRRAARLRKLTGEDRFRSQSELDQKDLNVREIAIESLWRPIQLILLDPSIAFTAVYTALIYGIFYSFFEGFPIVYSEGYGYGLGLSGLTFLSILVGVVIGIVMYWAYNWWYVEPYMRENGMGAPEGRLIPALFTCAFTPAGLFIFGWTSDPTIVFIVSLIGVSIFTTGIFIILQVIFLYLPLSYPQYSASLFAGNDFLRSTLAAGAIHFSYPLYRALGIGPGVSLLAGLTCGCAIGLFVLYYYGGNLRARSRFAAK